jgi:hypothetical protein
MGLAALVALAGAFLLAAGLFHGSVDGESLAHSLRSEIRADQSGPACERIDEFEWHCAVPSPSLRDGLYRYTLLVGGSCWEARLIARPPGVKLNTTEEPPESDGCVKLGDQLGILG